GLADPLGEPPFDLFHILFSLSFSILEFYIFGRSITASRYYSAMRLARWKFRRWNLPFSESPTLLVITRLAFPQLMTLFCSFLHVSVLDLFPNSLKLKFNNSKRISQTVLLKAQHECTQQDSITHAIINCALKDSSCDYPLAKMLKFTILSLNASSSSTKVLKFLHNKNDSLFTQSFSTI
ncbi:hypothetical protein H5410_031093, partial [Solanum commersonii]